MVISDSLARWVKAAEPRSFTRKLISPMVSDPTPDLGKVVTINHPNHCKSLLYALLIREIEKPEN